MSQPTLQIVGRFANVDFWYEPRVLILIVIRIQTLGTLTSQPQQRTIPFVFLVLCSNIKIHKPTISLTAQNIEYNHNQWLFSQNSKLHYIQFDIDIEEYDVNEMVQCEYA